MGTTSGETGRIAVDAMGGDLGPAEVVEAVRLALRQYPALNPITLVGDEAILTPLLGRISRHRRHHVSIHHASEVVTMDDKPLMALKRKKDSSMVRAIELVKDGNASVVVSCGNTGALMAAGPCACGRWKVSPVRPWRSCTAGNGHFILIDAGANPDAKPEHLVHNAILGSHYCRVMLGLQRRESA